MELHTFQVSCWPLSFSSPDVPPYYENVLVNASDAKEAAAKADEQGIPWACASATEILKFDIIGTVHAGRRHMVTPIEND